MCGIAAVHVLSAGTDPTPEQLTDPVATGEAMLARLRHRGPDGEGSVRTGPTWLGHARLSIVDVEGGAQPLGSPDGRCWAVVNGEVYNHDDLRGDLPGPFVTGSDSEMVRHVVAAHGGPGTALLRGMFAFCVAADDGSFVAARDPLGIKPLYWAPSDGYVAFASELVAFDVAARPRVEEFPPGHWWSPETGLVRYAHAPASTPELTDRDEALSLIRSTLVTAIRRRTMADAPVGVFLSGGLDSSLVAAVLAREAAGSGHRVPSFAAGTHDSPDLVAARAVADHLGLDHHERVYSDDDVAAALPAVVRSTESYEPSLIRSAVPNYLLAQTAAQHVKVVLTGEGADELFAGYDHMRSLDAAALAEELVRSVAGLHNLNLQRCDRVTMAHGLEARVPFLDLDVVALAQRIPIGWRLPGAEGQEKRILREAFGGWLPDDLLWRRKAQFGDGSGTTDVMARLARALAPGDDWQSVRLPGLPAARSREELGYQRVFAEHLGGIRADRVLGRFATA